MKGSACRHPRQGGGIACDLIDAGAQMMSRLVDGQNSLHLAARMDMAVVIRKMMETSKGDKAKAEKEGKVASGGDESEHLLGHRSNQ